MVIPAPATVRVQPPFPLPRAFAGWGWGNCNQLPWLAFLNHDRLDFEVLQSSHLCFVGMDNNSTGYQVASYLGLNKAGRVLFSRYSFI